MPFDRAIQSLSFIEEKLRRAFNLAGPIGAKLDPTLTPVLIAGDLRQPGHANDKGRSFAFVLNAGTPAGNSVYSLLFGTDVLIQGVYVTGEIGASLPITGYVTTPTETIPTACATAGGSWRDRKMLSGDVPPILTPGAAFAAITGQTPNTGNSVMLWRGTAAGTGVPIPERRIEIMVPAGGTFSWHSTGASVNAAFGLYGRIWP